MMQKIDNIAEKQTVIEKSKSFKKQQRLQIINRDDIHLKQPNSLRSITKVESPPENQITKAENHTSTSKSGLTAKFATENLNTDIANVTVPEFDPEQVEVISSKLQKHPALQSMPKTPTGSSATVAKRTMFSGSGNKMRLSLPFQNHFSSLTAHSNKSNKKMEFSSTPTGSHNIKQFNFGISESIKMSDMQPSTARDFYDSNRNSIDGVARPKRVTSFTVNQAKSANNSGNNTAGNVKESQTMRSNPTMNKKSQESDHTLTSRDKGSHNSGMRMQKFDPTQGLLGETNHMKMMYGPSLMRKKSSERMDRGESSTKKPNRISAKTMRS